MAVRPRPQLHHFAYDDLRLSADSIRAGDSLVVTVSVRNSGTVAGGRNRSRLYVSDEAASVTRPCGR